MKRFTKICTLVLALCSIFSFSIKDHDVRDAKASKGAGDEVWSLIGSVTDPITGIKDTWTKDFDFEYIRSSNYNYYELLFTFEEGDEFKIRKDHNWDIEIGYCENKGGGISEYLTNAGTYSKDDYGNAITYANFKVATAGTYLLRIADDDVANYGDKSYGFSLDAVRGATLKYGKMSAWFAGNNGSIQPRDISSVIFTTDINKRPNGWNQSYEAGMLGSAKQLTDDGKNIGAYLYTNKDNPSLYDLVIYANDDKIYAYAISSGLFETATYITSITFENFDTSNVIDMHGMFSECESLIKLDLSCFNTAKVTDMNEMFTVCSSLTEINVSSFNTLNLTTMENMFYGCSSLTSLNLENFDTSNATNISGMFWGCASLKTIDIRHFDTSKVTSMCYLFAQCTALENIDISTLDTSKVTAMEGMFAFCSNLKDINLSSFNTSKTERVYAMFMGCTSLEMLDLSNFDLSNIEMDFAGALEDGESGAGHMLAEMPNLILVKLPKAIKDGITIELPEQFLQNDGLTVVDNSMINQTVIAGSAALNELYNALYGLDTCTEYMKAPTLQTIYDRLTESDKVTFALLKDKEEVNMNDKFMYIQSYYAYKNPTEQADVHMMMNVNDSSSLLVITIAISSLMILGYYLMQKRKYAR